MAEESEIFDLDYEAARQAGFLVEPTEPPEIEIPEFVSSDHRPIFSEEEITLARRGALLVAGVVVVVALLPGGSEDVDPGSSPSNKAPIGVAKIDNNEPEKGVNPKPSKAEWISTAPNIDQWYEDTVVAIDRLEGAGVDMKIDANHVGAIIYLESRGNPRAFNSSSDATGLTQFLPGTWIAMQRQLAEIGITIGDDPRDPQDNILAGAFHMNRFVLATDNLAAAPIGHHGGGGSSGRGGAVGEFLSGEGNRYHGPKNRAYAIRWLALINELVDPYETDIYDPDWVEDHAYLLEAYR